MIALLSSLIFSIAATAQVLPERIEIRYCYSKDEVPRNADGSIKRSTWTITKFKEIHPCPSTGMSEGSCPNWQIDHVIPLACGGCDSVNNMQWLPVQAKTCAEDYCKDRFERVIYCK